MKLRNFILTVFMITSSLILFSCKSVDLETNALGLSENASITAKDYDIIGTVRVESEEQINIGPFGIYKSHNGSQITYDMLLNEAHNKGADDLINIRIDKIKDSNSIFYGIFGRTEKYKYIGTALAIKYKDSIPNSIDGKSSIQVPSNEILSLRELFKNIGENR